MNLAVVTATTNRKKAEDCISSWERHATTEVRWLIHHNGAEGSGYEGTVGAFRRATDEALRLYPQAEVIACLHDDLQILEPGWDAKVLRYFERNKRLGLAGFGGAVGLGDADIYQKPYSPMQLARIGFRSDLDDAEQHGIRSRLAEPVACLDGFSQIGRRAFWEGEAVNRTLTSSASLVTNVSRTPQRPWTQLEDLGFVHHFYDSALGCLARRAGWETWYIPIRCHHFGGRTAVGDPGYQAWAKTQDPKGDQGFWEHAHRIGYDAFRDVLPLRPLED